MFKEKSSDPYSEDLEAIKTSFEETNRSLAEFNEQAKLTDVKVKDLEEYKELAEINLKTIEKVAEVIKDNQINLNTVMHFAQFMSPFLVYRGLLKTYMYVYPQIILQLLQFEELNK